MIIVSHFFCMVFSCKAQCDDYIDVFRHCFFYQLPLYVLHICTNLFSVLHILLSSFD